MTRKSSLFQYVIRVYAIDTSGKKAHRFFRSVRFLCAQKMGRELGIAFAL